MSFKDLRVTWARTLHLSIVLIGGLFLVSSARSALAQTMPELSLGMRGRIRSTEGVGTEHLALVELEFVPPVKSTPVGTGVAFTEVESDLESAPGSEVPLDPLERDDPTGPMDASSAPRRGRDVPTKQQALLKEIPYVVTPAFAREVLDAAFLAQGVTLALGRLDSLSSRAKNSAILPEARVRAGRDVDQSLRLTPTAEDPYRYSRSGGVSFVIEGAVTWRLGRLLFASEELSIERLRLAQARERQRVTHSTMNELFTWQAAWRRVAAFGDKANNAKEELIESSVRLDVLTGGWFSAHQPALPSGNQASKHGDLQPKPAATPPTERERNQSSVPRVQSLPKEPKQARRNPELMPSAVQLQARGLERFAFSR